MTSAIHCTIKSFFCSCEYLLPCGKESNSHFSRPSSNINFVVFLQCSYFSWLPLNTLKTLLDFSPNLIETYLGGQDTLVYGLANILGLGNACVNPVLYGYLNENFRKEYKSIYRKIPWNNASSSVQRRRRRFSSSIMGGPQQRMELKPVNSEEQNKVRHT